MQFDSAKRLHFSPHPLFAAISFCLGSALPLSSLALSVDDAFIPEHTDLEIRASNIQVSHGEATLPAPANTFFSISEGSSIRGQLSVEPGIGERTYTPQTCQVNFDIVAREDIDRRLRNSTTEGVSTTFVDSNKSITVTIDENGVVSSTNTDFEVEIVDEISEGANKHFGIYADNVTTTCISLQNEDRASVSGYFYVDNGYVGGAVLYGNVTGVAQAPEEPANEDTPEVNYKIQQATDRVKAQLESSTNLALHNARTRNKNLARELAKRRISDNRLNTSGLSTNINGQRLSLAPLGGAAGDKTGAWGGFINGSIEIGEDKQFDISSDILIAGVDYKTQHWILGAAYTYASGSSEQDIHATADLTQSGLSLFASYFNRGFYSNFIVSQSASDYELSRAHNGAFAKGNTDGNEWSYAFSAGFQGNNGQWNYRTFAIFDATDLDVDGYHETGADLNFAVNDIEREVQNLELGIHLNYTINMSFGVLNPFAEISYRSNTGRKHWSANAHYTAADGTTGAQALSYAINDDKYLTGQFGVSAVFPHGWSAFLSYQQDFNRDEWDVKQYDLGLRWEF